MSCRMCSMFHVQDFIKLLSSSRKAAIVLRYLRLPSNYPLLMHAASAGGTQRWTSGVRPPAYSTMRLCDHATASALRNAAGWDLTTSALFLQLPRRQGLCSQSAHLWATSDFAPLLGTPQMAGVM